MPDWVTNAVDAKYAFSMFNKSEQASIFGSDVQNYMDLATRSTTPVMTYAQYTRTHPTSQQPQAVASGEDAVNRAWAEATGWALAAGKGAFDVAWLPIKGTLKELWHGVAHPIDALKQKLARLEAELGFASYAMHNPSKAYQSVKAGFGVLKEEGAAYYQGLSTNKKIEYSTFLLGTAALAISTDGVILEADEAALSARGIFGGRGAESLPETKSLASPRDFYLSKVEHPKLYRIVDRLYRPNAKFGAGSTADAVRHELSSGELLSRTSHIQKAIESRNALSGLMHSSQLSASDEQVALWIREDLQNALTEQPWDKIYLGRQGMTL